MYRLALLVVLAVFTGQSYQQSCQRHRRHNPGNLEHYHEMQFNDLAQKVMDLDRKVKSACERHSNAATKEIVETNRYVIQTPLADYTDKDVVIKIRQKVIQIDAKKGDKHYTELRILPNFVDVANAAYTLEDGLLEVTFPFKAGPNTCDSNFSNSVTIVPEFDPFGNGTGPRGSFAG